MNVHGVHGSMIQNCIHAKRHDILNMGRSGEVV